ncbi:hypothetical protein CEXT_444021 [Caerostris extrusa]|uniref:Uncharacterized protein n=1 Tax=Caerostris extrusa TaxID=172846 RepID=A0AAV4SSB7_CAEEX|nr:hypothetical protein CEXT_444021 [Caerostris extrusa]
MLATCTIATEIIGGISHGGMELFKRWRQGNGNFLCGFISFATAEKGRSTAVSNDFLKINYPFRPSVSVLSNRQRNAECLKIEGIEIWGERFY